MLHNKAVRILIAAACLLAVCACVLFVLNKNAEPAEESISSAETAQQTTPAAETTVTTTAAQQEQAAQQGTASSYVTSQATETAKQVPVITLTPKGNDEYTFVYNSHTFTAQFSVYGENRENWRVTDSYLITDREVITAVCQALINEKKVHGKDLTSYRTASDMSDEWSLHNLAYQHLSEGSAKQHAKDVDLNTDDQGKTLMDYLRKYMNGDYNS